MNSNYLPTKTNLIKLQESLRITKQGHELLERKRMEDMGKPKRRNPRTTICSR